MTDVFERAGDFEGLQEQTMEAVEDPQVGDVFHEMYSVWVYVIRVEEHRIWTLHIHPPGKLPDDGTLHILGRTDFRRKMTYTSDREKPVMLISNRGADVEGWAEYAIEQEMERVGA